MRSLLEVEPLAALADNLRTVADALPDSGSVTLLSSPTLEGAFALAQLEAAMLDADLPYRRRFLPREATGSCIEIGEGSARGEPISVTKSPLKLRLVPLTVVALHGHDGAAHKGTLSPVAQAAALAEAIAPDGERVRSLRPWALTGNWCSGGLDQGYDPVYSRLRDHLREEGSIRVVALPEVETPDLSALPGLDPKRLASTRTSWQSLDMEQRADALAALALPLVLQSSPATARLEELLWHRILIAGSESDLHSTLSKLENDWVETPATASALIDQLIVGGF